jgi:hypothetical protein
MTRKQLFVLADSLQLHLDIDPGMVNGHKMRVHNFGDLDVPAEFKIIASAPTPDGVAVLCQVLGQVGLFMSVQDDHGQDDRGHISGTKAIAVIVDLGKLPYYGSLILNKVQPRDLAAAGAIIAPAAVKRFRRLGAGKWTALD